MPKFDQRLHQAVNLCVSGLFASALLLPDFAQGISVVLLLLGVVANCYLPKTTMPPALIWIATAMLAYLLIFVAYGVYNGESLRYFDARSRWLLLALYVYLLHKIELKPGSVLYGIAAGALLALGLALYQHLVQNMGRVNGDIVAINFGNLAWVFGSISALAMVAKLKQRQYLLASLLFLASIAGITSSLLSASRGGWIAIIVFVPLSLFFIFSTLNRFQRRLTLTGFTLSFLLLGGLYGDIVSQRTTLAISEYKGFMSGEKLSSSVGLRLGMWKGGMQCVESNLITGLSVAEKKACFEDLIQNQGYSPTLKVFDHLHSDYVDALVFTGLPGLAAFLLLNLLFLLVFGRYWRNAKSIDAQATALAGGMVVLSYACFSLSQSMHQHMIGVTSFGFLLICLALSCESQNRQDQKSS